MGRGCHPFSDEMGVFLRVDLWADLESWLEDGDSLCHSKKETANNWEREVSQAFSGNPNLQQGQQGSSHWVWVTGEDQLGVKIWPQSNTLFYALAASLLGLEQRQLCQFATITVQRLWVPCRDHTSLFSSNVPVLPSIPQVCSQLLPDTPSMVVPIIQVVWHLLKQLPTNVRLYLGSGRAVFCLITHVVGWAILWN